MKALLQRVTRASVEVSGAVVGEIAEGLLLFLGCAQGDTSREAARLAERVLAYRIFEDEGGLTNLNVQQLGGAILLVSQFTLCADTKKGTRPSFSTALAPELAQPLVDEVEAQLRKAGVEVAAGVFGAKMEVALVNSGPATYLLDVPPRVDLK